RIALTPDHLVAIAQPSASPIASLHGRKRGDGGSDGSLSTRVATASSDPARAGAIDSAARGSAARGSEARGSGATELGATNPLATSAETGSGSSTRSGSGSGGGGPVLRSIHRR